MLHYSPTLRLFWDTLARSTLKQLDSFLRDLGYEASPQTLSRFAQFRDALYSANAVHNLTAIPREECELRHFIDSLLILDLIPLNSKILDIGTGPGFPAWPLACARPDLNVTAIDSTGKMLGFLMNQPLPNLQVVHTRAEDFHQREAFEFVTGRAVAPLTVQLELSAAFCKVNGFVLPFRTPNDLAEMERFNPGVLGLKLAEIQRRELPGTNVLRVFPLYRKFQKTSKEYPRAWALMKKQPF